MSNQIALKDKIKTQVILIILYIFSEITAFILLLDVHMLGNWNAEGKKISIIIGVISFTAILFICVKKLDSRKIFSYFNVTECIVLSLIILQMVLKRYYNLYEKLGLEIIYIYVAVIIILFLLNKDFYKKLPSEEELNKKKKKKPQRGLAYVVAASTLGIVRHLTVNALYVAHIIVSLLISCGWLVLGWVIFQGTKSICNNDSSEMELLNQNSDI